MDLKLALTEKVSLVSVIPVVTVLLLPRNKLQIGKELESEKKELEKKYQTLRKKYIKLKAKVLAQEKAASHLENSHQKNNSKINDETVGTPQLFLDLNEE